MTKSSLRIVLFCIWLVSLSILYLLSLAIALPIWITIILLAIGTFGAVRYGSYFLPSVGDNEIDNRIDWTRIIILMAGLTLIVYKTYLIEEKYGHWDAWWFWNVRANFLARPEYWKNAFLGQQWGTPFTVPVAHADYPPFLPLVIGFIWRLMGIQPSVIPFTMSMIPALLIPTILFWEIYGKNKVIAVAVLLFFATQEHIFSLNAAQTADSWIALFFLLAMMSYHYFETTKDRKYLFLVGALLGCSLWTKNEGLILSVVFILFFLRTLLLPDNRKQFIAGLITPPPYRIMHIQNNNCARQ